MPGVVSDGDRRLPTSYANFYVGNEVVLVPAFHHANDAKALDVLARLFPTRKIVGVPCAALVYGYGAIHCVTQQQPQP
jgi:agmatine deiminase